MQFFGCCSPYSHVIATCDVSVNSAHSEESIDTIHDVIAFTKFFFYLPFFCTKRSASTNWLRIS